MLRLFNDTVSTADVIQRLCIFPSVHHYYIRGRFEKFVDWRQRAAVMQTEALTVMPSCSGGGNVTVA
jgi:hypothetical protein